MGRDGPNGVRRTLPPDIVRPGVARSIFQMPLPRMIAAVPIALARGM
jgi:hypothetical protein